MKIELKNTEFKILYEFLKNLSYEEEELPIHTIVFKELGPQYDEAFNKYNDEKQEFNKNEKVLFRWSKKNDWIEGKIYKISKLANGQYKYIIIYEDDITDYSYNNQDKIVGKCYTNPMAKKNIKKYEN